MRYGECLGCSKVFIIGITGGTGAGKTSALRALKNLGALVLDCDAIYHQLLSESMELKSEIGAKFGNVLNGGEIDRERLGEIVFSDPAALLDLNAIAHKFVSEETDRQIAKWKEQGGTVAAIDAIALVESGRGEKCDVVIGITAPVETRIARIMKRDGITRKQAEMRINAQKPDSFFERNCDYILESKYDTPEKFEEKCREFFAQLIGRSR